MKKAQDRQEGAMSERPDLLDLPPERPSWDVYFLAIAAHAATRATCDRKHVGAVIVLNKMVLATGYNGSIRGEGHCDDEGHLMEDGHCVRTIHAEVNAIAQAARVGTRIDGATMYVTAMPCWPCFKVIVNAGIKRIVYSEEYRPDPRVVEASVRARIGLVHFITSVA